MSETYPRDMVGYGGQPPDPKWPGGARIAVQVVLNYEEGGERSVLHGDDGSESFLTDAGASAPVHGMRNPSVESTYEYGTRAGFWRLQRIFTARAVPVTVYGTAMALARNRAAVRAMIEANWEIASHGLRWLDYQHIGEADEREHLHNAVQLHTRVTGSRPLGWYTGRTSPNTRRLVIEEGGFLYDSDSYADDLPYWIHDFGRPHLVIPYSLDTNDMRFAMHPGFVTGDEFFCYLRDAFETLYAEGETAPKMMSIGLHCRLSGRPGRSRGLERFLDLVQSRDRVWLCRRIDIAKHWHALHGAVSASPNQCDQ
jgi:putative urate catabolism protein